jgi:hypothetical protein
VGIATDREREKEKLRGGHLQSAVFYLDGKTHVTIPTQFGDGRVIRRRLAVQQLTGERILVSNQTRRQIRY